MTNGTQPYNPTRPEATSRFWPIVATVVALLLVTLFVRAALWQWGRAAEKEAMLAQFEAALAAEVLRRPVQEHEADDYRYRRFELQGVFEPQRQILLDNSVAGGRAGYEVLTPFRTQGFTIMVNRGWIAANPDRSILPDVTISAGQRTLVGILDRFPAPGMRLEPPEDGNQWWPRRMLYPDKEAIQDVTGLTIAPYQLKLDPAEPDGFLRSWKVVGKGPEQNYGYAFQWSAFTTLTIIFYVILMRRWFVTRPDSRTGE